MGLRLHGRLTEVRPATEDDADLLVAWHADPEVSRYWDDETFTREEILERLRRPDVDSYVVEVDGRPVGFLQAWWEGAEPRAGGIDMFVAPEARGCGYGSDAARTLTESLLASGWTGVTVDPYAWNETAVRAWRRTGFVEIERRPPDEDHLSDWILMEFQSAPGSS
jgi:aminoglycoside 6'-N-acetyltransferase